MALSFLNLSARKQQAISKSKMNSSNELIKDMPRNNPIVPPIEATKSATEIFGI
jgi:hypothetical protein